MGPPVLSQTRFDVHRVVTDKIIAAIEAGAGEFKMPWHSPGAPVGRPVNASTKQRYRGINVVALWAQAMLAGYGSGAWASYQQWQKLGAQVRKGEQGCTVVFYRDFAADDDDSEEGRRRRFVARAASVFNAGQVEGWRPDGLEDDGAEVLPDAEEFIKASGAEIRHGGSTACYIPSRDWIEMPERRWFFGASGRPATESYYAVLLHELVHWTGASHRLDRNLTGRFGSDAYALEELVAELGSAFLCAELGLANEPRLDHAAYLQSWLRVLKADARALFVAAKDATAAALFLSERTSEAAPN
jgi:antirestriction protein ArdC